jgi:hypothetical protein
VVFRIGNFDAGAAKRIKRSRLFEEDFGQQQFGDSSYSESFSFRWKSAVLVIFFFNRQAFLLPLAPMNRLARTRA